MATQISLDELCINTIRTLSMDAVQKAKIGTSRNAHGNGRRRLRSLDPVPAA